MVRIAIIGMGLMGASLGMALRSSDAPPLPDGPLHITGYDRDPHATRTARGRLAIDAPAHSLAEAVHQARVVVVATPVQAVLPIFRELAPLLPEGAVVTDVASTKAQVCAWAEEVLPEHVDFVGGHPMAGKEQAGASAADPDLFKGAIYCLTPLASAQPQALEMVETLATMTGARPYYIDPEEHDTCVAGISHLPFLLSAALVEVTSRSAGWNEMSHLAATGFRDISRLASGDVTMHRDICLTNRTALTHWINEMIALLTEVRGHLEDDQAAAVEHFFAHAREVRDHWLERKQQGGRPGEEALDAARQVERPPLFGLRWPGRPGKKRRP
jgi:prephenate dehydrogenase